MTIFGELAPKYWAVGLPAIPLHPGEKRPVMPGWNIYSTAEISTGDKLAWQSTYPNHNIGLVLGPRAGIVMMDIDTQDQGLIGVIQKLLPVSPWERYGMKGVMLAYKFAGEHTFRIKNKAGETLVELLSSRTQCVLPGSIHPITKAPYTSNCDLFDPEVLANLPTLPPDIEAILRSAFEERGIELTLSGHTRVTDYVAVGARDVSMTSIAGFYAHAVLKGELSFMEAIQRIVAWYHTCVEKVAGDDIDIDKGIRKIAEFLIKDVKGPKQRTLPVGWDEGLTDELRTAFGFTIFDETSEQWSFDRLKNYLKQAYSTHDIDTEGRRNAVRYFLSRLASSDLSPLEQSQLLTYAISAGQLKVTPSVLKKELAKLQQEGIAGINHGEIADKLVADIAEFGELAFDGGQFWQWAGSHWSNKIIDFQSSEQREVDIKSFLLRLIVRDYGHLPAAKKASDHQGILKTAEILSLRPLKLTEELGVNFANGFVNEHLEVLEHSPDFGCIYTLPYRYLPDQELKAPKFERFLEFCWGQDNDYLEKKAALQEAICVTLFGAATRLERVFCLYGPPASGKSQLLKIVQNLLPPQTICAIGPEAWGDRFLPAQLAGKMLNIAGELSEKKLIDGKMFKSIVSGETVTGQHKHGQPFTFTPMCAHWFASNHTPRTDDTSAGFMRRWLLLTFNRPVPQEEKVLNLGFQIAAEEREAISTWAMGAISRLLAKRDYTLPSSHLSRMEEVSKSNNTVRAFLLDSGRVITGRLIAASSESVLEADLYNAYFTFALAAGVAKPVSLSTFRHQMRELGYELGFNLRLRNNAQGYETCYYEQITLVNKSADLSSKVRLRG